MDSQTPKKSPYAFMNKITFLFIFGLIVLLFFSKTIVEYNLPAVSVTYAAEGIIHNTLRAEGHVILEGRRDLFSSYDGKVETLLTEGAEIEIGTPLYKISTDLEDIEDELEVLSQTRETLNISLNKAANDIEYYNGLLNAENPTETFNSAAYDVRINQAELELESKKKETLTARELYSEGIIPLNELEDLEEEISQLELSLLEMDVEKSVAQIEFYTDLAEREKDDSEAKAESQKAIEDLNFQRNSLTVELEFTNKRIEDLTSQLANNGIIEVLAEEEGQVTEIYETAETGQYVTKNEPLLAILPAEALPVVKFSVKDDTEFINEEDPVFLNINARRRYNLPGTVRRVFYDNTEEAMTIEVLFNEKILFEGGETIEALFEKKSNPYPAILPNSAIKESGSDRYALYVKRVKNAFGYDYVAESLPLLAPLSDRNNSYVTWTELKGDNLPVIVSSSKIVAPGMEVRIVGGSDIDWTDEGD